MFKPRGPKRLTLNGVDFFEHDRGLLIGNVPGGPGIAQRWRRIRDEAVKMGRWPVLVNDGYVLREEVHDKESGAPEEILAEAARFDRAKWLDEERRMSQQDFEDAGSEAEEGEDPTYYQAKPDQIEQFANRSIFPALTDLEITESSLGAAAEWVCVALLPTPDSWKVHAYIPNGAWNSYPHPGLCAGILRSWHDRYGAEVVMMTEDQLYLWVPEPVHNTEEVCRLAEEQYFFCPDLLNMVEGGGTGFASDLRRHRVWSFWWD